MQYIASCSFGKDLLATVLLAMIHGEPLDAVVYAKVMFDQYTSAEVPEHESFITNTAIPQLEQWGIPVHIATSQKTFIDCFNHERVRGKNVGKKIGYPLMGRCVVQRDCKMAAIKQSHEMFDKDSKWYVGIAKDEPKRLERLSANQISLLDKYGYTEEDAVQLCKQFNLYSPVDTHNKIFS